MIPSVACSCYSKSKGEEEDVKSALDEANVVFLGKAFSVQTTPPKFDANGEEIQSTIFDVIKSWKGKLGQRVTTRINIQCCVCGIEFQEDYVYLVYGYETDSQNVYSTSICSRTKARELADRDIEILEQLWSESVSNTENLEEKW